MHENKEVYLMPSLRSCYIDGVWRMRSDTTEQTVNIMNPWNQEVVFQYSEATSEDVEDAVASAARAFQTPLTPQKRAAVLLRASEILEQKTKEMAERICLETGKPIRDARAEVSRAVANFRMASEEAGAIHGYTEQQDRVEGDLVISMTVREPLGVVCAITPFNFPLNITSLKVAPALAAGNTVVFKPADGTPWTAVLLADILTEAGLPAGHLNVVLGGPRVGRDLVANTQIALYSFTGSVSVGQTIKEQSGLRPVILELGSNAPNIVHHDANLPQAVEALAKAAFAFAGQVCVSAQRIYVHQDIFNAFLDRFTQRVSALLIGDPLSETTDVGPLINERAAIRVESWIQDAVASGAILHTGGTRRGNLLDPVVLTNVRKDLPIVCSEAFGPVVTVIPYDTVGQVIEACNDSTFGLQAGVFTQNVDVAFTLARGLQMGSVNINQSSMARPDSMPYGGVKNSGIGKEGARASIEYMTQPKIITFRYKTII